MVPAASYAHHPGMGLGMFQVAMPSQQQYTELLRPLQTAAPTTPTNTVMRKERKLEDVGSSFGFGFDAGSDFNGCGKAADDGIFLKPPAGRLSDGVDAEQQGRSNGIMQRRGETEAEGHVEGEQVQGDSVTDSRGGGISEQGRVAMVMEGLEREVGRELSWEGEGSLRYPRYSRRVQSKSEPVTGATAERHSSLGERSEEEGT